MASLYVLQGPDKGCAFQLDAERSILGRYAAHVPLTDHTVSRQHAELSQHGEQWEITDLGSSNSTYVNGERIHGATVLQHGDQIKIGGTILAFKGKADVDGFVMPRDTAREVIDVAAPDGTVDSSILSAIQSNEESMILAAPETAEAVRAWNLMYRLAEAIGTIRSVHDFLQHITDIILQHLVVDRVFILMRDEVTNELEPVAVRYHRKRKGKRERIATSRTIINHVIDTSSGVLCANASADERFHQDDGASSVQSLALRSVICVPIIASEKVLGVMHIDCPMSRHTYTHEQLRLATAIGRVVGMTLENHRLVEARMRNERLAATGETVAYLSHHIRNILQGLRSGADVVDLGLKGENAKTTRTGWQIVKHNLDRIFRLTTDMLTFSKDRVPRIEQAQINSIIVDALDLAQRQADDRGVALERDLGDLPPVPVDQEGIHQAIFNLLINAIAASPSATGSVTVRSRFIAATNQISVSVRDNGRGIPPEGIKHIFRPFHSSKGQGGTGLGLAAAKKIVDELDGQINVESTLGEGSCFEIVLPAERTMVTDAGATCGGTR